MCDISVADCVQLLSKYFQLKPVCPKYLDFAIKKPIQVWCERKLKNKQPNIKAHLKGTGFQDIEECDETVVPRMCSRNVFINLNKAA